jgi:hypothetical protein
MGACGSRRAAVVTQRMDLLLLGFGGVGKSTILRQLLLSNKVGFTEEELTESKARIFSNLVEICYFFGVEGQECVKLYRRRIGACYLLF